MWVDHRGRPEGNSTTHLVVYACGQNINAQGPTAWLLTGHTPVIHTLLGAQKGRGTVFILCNYTVKLNDVAGRWMPFKWRWELKYVHSRISKVKRAATSTLGKSTWLWKKNDSLLFVLVIGKCRELNIDHRRSFTASWAWLIYDPEDLMAHFTMLFCSDSLWICTSGDIYIYGKW